MTHIGIDLGTTYSCVIQHSDAGDQVIASTDGGELTPSVVYFDPDGSVVVGEAARKLSRSDPGNAVFGIKRHMGTDHPLEFHGAKFTPEAISGIILKRLAMDAASRLGVKQSQLRSVVTVPAYFGVAEKEATLAAARIAGLNCLELLAEPVAAAYAYGADPDLDDSVLVFDLGGGTFDVAVVGMADHRPKVWAVDGETQLGGLDWDRRLADLLWERLTVQGIEEDAIYDEDFSVQLLAQAELLKRNLTVHEAATARVRYGGRTLSASVTRNAFDAATADLLEQCLSAAGRVVATAGSLGSRPVSRVLLVGGSTRMPMIRAGLEHVLRLPALLHDPDKAVATGAAILASRLAAPRGISTRRSTGQADVTRITPVLPKAIGMKVHSSRLPVRPDPYVLNMLAANTPLPATAKVTVATIVPDQPSCRIELYEQAGATRSEELGANRLLFDGEVTGIRPGPAGSPIVVSLTIEVDGRMEVAALDGATGGRLPFEAFIHGVLDEQEIGEQITNVSGLMMVL